MSYTKGLWRANQLATSDGTKPLTVKIYAGKLLVAETPLYEKSNYDPFSNAWRIARCVNACAGMTNPIADIAALKEAVEVQGLQLEMAAAAERVSVSRFQKINNLQPQAEALHRIASLFDLPAGTDVTVETLNCVKSLKQQRDELLAALQEARKGYADLATESQNPDEVEWAEKHRDLIDAAIRKGGAT